MRSAVLDTNIAVHSTKTPLSQRVVWTIVLCVAAGCSQLIDPNVPEPIRPMVEPLLGRPYLLYRPSGYDRDSGWPLIIVCHSSFPDSPNRQIREWTQLAESRGFLVAAPKLTGVASRFPSASDRQRSLQSEDERRIIATVQHVQAGHNISEDRIFIHGWSGGAYAALYAALRNPDRFRAVSLIQPRFDPDSFVDVGKIIDRHQPVLVHYNSGDALSGKHAARCVQWLRSHDADVRDDPLGPARRSDTPRAVEFFERVIRKDPWIRIRAFPRSTDNPFEMQFKLKCSLVPARYSWEFGDGEVSNEAEPIHIYVRPGTYRVTVTVDDADRHSQSRSIQLTVPQAFLHPVPAMSPND